MRLLSNIFTFENPWDNTPNKSREQGKGHSQNSGADLEEMIKKSQDKVLQFILQKRGGKGNGNPPVHNKKSAMAIGLVLLFMWLATGFYTVDTDQEGVIMLFGKYHRTSTPGLNYKLPAPLESVEKLSVTRINKELIGVRSFVGKAPSGADDSDASIPKESQMLTGDENLIEMHFFVQWYINNAKDYLFNIKDDMGESTIRVTSESVMRQVVGRVKISEALSEQRQEIEQKTKVMLQDILNRYNAGIEVVNVGILYSYVAPEVRDAYRDIQSAKADKEREINQSYSYRNDMLPRARGEAQSIIESAKAYKETVIARSTGEAERFKNILSQYQNAKDITRERLYIETMEDVLKDVNKVIVDQGVANKAIPLFSINELVKKK